MALYLRNTLPSISIAFGSGTVAMRGDGVEHKKAAGIKPCRHSFFMLKNRDFWFLKPENRGDFANKNHKCYLFFAQQLLNLHCLKDCDPVIFAALPSFELELCCFFIFKGQHLVLTGSLMRRVIPEICSV